LAGKRTSKGKKERSFEEALGRLEEIVLELEEGELSLEEAVQILHGQANPIGREDKKAGQKHRGQVQNGPS
jgi:exonuclease VII small subunit